MSPLNWILPGLTAAVVSWWAVGWLARSGGLWLDIPTARSSHRLPTPRGGGLGLLAGAAAGVAVAAWSGTIQQLPGSLVLATLIVAGAGLADDMRGGLPPVFRLAVQLIAAILVTGSCGPIERLPLPDPAAPLLGWAGYPLTVLWLVGVTNIYNFLDGIDGLAAVQGLAAGLALALAVGTAPEAQVALSLAGGCAGFLVHNWHPARIFLGDVGSAALGFLFAAIPLYATRDAAERAELVWLAILVLWFFLADGAFTLCRRVWRGERVWEPHRSHLYQRLVQTGWSHARVALTVGLATVALAASAAAARSSMGVGARWSVTGMAVVAFAVYWAAVVRREREARGRQPGEAVPNR
jgi:UDP-N-acetylmuramyl pentapeptide phosphotransferase/UDP-N-acetylglucosamine-1-phosphate transferase